MRGLVELGIHTSPTQVVLTECCFDHRLFSKAWLTVACVALLTKYQG